MIVFDLRCGGDHVFEAWFASTAAYEAQRDGGMIACPLCGASDVQKAVMAPRVGAKGNSAGAAVTTAVAAPAAEHSDARALLSALARAQAAVLKDSRWVGKRFADEARAIHNGDKPGALIHGQATAAEAKALVDDGVAIAPLLVPVVPPEALN